MDNLDLEREKLKLDIDRQYQEMRIDGVKWRNRRSMAWMASISIVMITIALFVAVPESKLIALSDITTIFYFIQVSIVAGYFGTASFEAVKLPPKR